MSTASEQAGPPAWEAPVVVLAGWLLLVSIPLVLGEMGISWDALNHHIYLGWTAERPRFDRDFLAAASQTYQFPYLYWPVFKLAQMDVSGRVAGAVLATLQALALPALWLVARACIPGGGWLPILLRAQSVFLGYASILILSLFDSTANDMLATVPFVWSVALALQPVGGAPSRTDWHHVIGSGVLMGIAVACKWSNGPLSVLLVIFWILAPGDARRRLLLVLAGGTATIVAFLVVYSYWGWQLWLAVGNPLHPFADAYFAPLRDRLGWHP